MGGRKTSVNGEMHRAHLERLLTVSGKAASLSLRKCGGGGAGHAVSCRVMTPHHLGSKQICGHVPETPALGYFESSEALGGKGFQRNVNPEWETHSPEAGTVS